MALPNIGLIGKLRAGKDEVAKYLAENYGYVRFAFGDALKDDFHTRYPEVPREPKPRAGYQFHGQFMRERDPNLWVRKCFEEIEDTRVHFEYYTEPFRAVITDCRQPNEHEALKSAGYTLIRVDAPDTVRIQRAIESGDTFNYADLMHGTETALDDYEADFTVDNSGTLAELYAQIDTIMAALGGQQCAV